MRALKIAALVVLGLLAAAIAALAWAPGAVLRAGLQAAGVEGITFDDLRLGLAGAEIEGLALGDHRLARLRIDYRLGDLLRGRVGSVDVEGLQLTGRIAEDGVVLPGFDGAGPGLPLPRPERIVVERASADLASPWGEVQVPFTAEVRPDGAEAAFTIESEDARLVAGGGQLHAVLSLDGRVPLGSPLRIEQVEARGHLELAAEGFDHPRIGGAIDGRASLDVVARDGVLSAEVSELLVELASPAPRLARLGPSLRPPWRIRLADRGDALRVVAGTGGDGLSVALEGALAATTGGGATAAIETDLAAALDPDQGGMLRRLSGNGAVRVANLRLDGVALREGRIGIEGDGRPGRWQAALDVELAGDAEPRPGLGVSGATLRQALAATGDGDRLTVEAEDTGTLTVGQVAWQAGRTGASSWRLLPGERPLATATLGDDGPGPWQYALAVEGEPFALDLDGEPPIRGQVDPGALSLEISGDGGRIVGGRARLGGWRLQLPAWQLGLGGIRTEVALAAEGLAPDQAIPLTIASIRHGGEPPWFAPLGLTGELRPEGDRIAFHAKLARAAAGFELDVSGEHDAASGRGRATLELAPLVFAPHGRRPGDLAPILDGHVAAVDGRFALGGTVAWGAGSEIAADLGLLVANLALTVGPARIEQVNGLLTFDRLWPPTTPPRQQLAIGLLDLGLPLTSGLAAFELLPGPALAISDLRWSFAGGTVGAEPFELASGGSEIVLTLRADRLDLGELLALTRLDGLSGQGSIRGTLPVRISGAEAVIDGGELEAEAPGWLRYRPDQTPPALAEQGEGVDLLLRALEDFRYEALRITLDGRTDALMRMGLHLRGANPDLYGGHPIEFNLALEGELANILRSGLASWRIPQQIPGRILERMRRFRAR